MRFQWPNLLGDLDLTLAVSAKSTAGLVLLVISSSFRLFLQPRYIALS